MATTNGGTTDTLRVRCGLTGLHELDREEAHARAADLVAFAHRGVESRAS